MAAEDHYVNASAQGSIRQCMITGMDCDGGCDNCETARDHRLAVGGIYIRPEVVAFAEKMESVLCDHDGNKGDSWKDLDIDVLWPKFHNKYDDLCCFCSSDQDDQDNLIDLANYAMMLWQRMQLERKVAV